VIGQQVRERGPRRLRDSSDEVYLLDERKVASWSETLEACESLWDLPKIGDRIHLLFAPTPEAATRNAVGLKVLRKVYRTRLAALKRNRPR
jgi:hypothetical protein